MFDRPALQLTKPLVDGMARRALRRGWNADQVTFAALALGLTAAVFIIIGNSGVALIPLLASRLADGMDGAMARMTETESDRGAFLDIVFDFIFYASIPLAFGLAVPSNNALPAAVLLAASSGFRRPWSEPHSKSVSASAVAGTACRTEARLRSEPVRVAARASGRIC